MLQGEYSALSFSNVSSVFFDFPAKFVIIYILTLCFKKRFLFLSFPFEPSFCNREITRQLTCNCRVDLVVFMCRHFAGAHIYEYISLNDFKRSSSFHQGGVLTYGSRFERAGYHAALPLESLSLVSDCFAGMIWATSHRGEGMPRCTISHDATATRLEFGARCLTWWCFFLSFALGLVVIYV